MRSVLLLAAFACGLLNAWGQASVTNGFAEKGFYMGFIPSADRSALAYYTVGANGKISFTILDLKDFSQRSFEAFDARAVLTPDLRAQYWIERVSNMNYDSTKPNFRLHYSPDATITNKKIYDGNFYPFGFTPDGKAIAADVSLGGRAHMITVRNLRIVDPATGVDLKILIPGPVLTSEESQKTQWGQKYNWAMHSGKGLLMRTNLESPEVYLFRFDGKPAIKHSNIFAGGLADTLLLGGSSYNPSTGSGRLLAFGMLSGRKLLDTSYFGRIFASGWDFADGRLWALHEGTKGITEYELTGGPLKILKVHPLDLSAVTFYSSSSNYQSLIVSRATNRVALLPNWDNYSIPINEAYIWELSTGKLLHKVTNFYTLAIMGAPVLAFNKEKAEAAEKAYMAKVAAEAAAKAAAGPCGDAKAALKVKVGTWVREGRGRPIYLSDYDCKANQYIGETRFATEKALSTTTFPINLFEVSSSLGSPKYQVINVHTCRKCDGAGTISGKRNYEKVDYGIYYKYTTKGTTSFTDLCGECKGDGVIVY